MKAKFFTFLAACHPHKAFTTSLDLIRPTPELCGPPPAQDPPHHAQESSAEQNQRRGLRSRGCGWVHPYPQAEDACSVRDEAAFALSRDAAYVRGGACPARRYAERGPRDAAKVGTPAEDIVAPRGPKRDELSTSSSEVFRELAREVSRYDISRSVRGYRTAARNQ